MQKKKRILQANNKLELFIIFFFHITLRLGKDQKYVSQRGRGGRVVGNTGLYQIQIVVNNSERYQTGELCLNCLGRIPVKIVNQKTLQQFGCEFKMIYGCLGQSGLCNTVHRRQTVYLGDLLLAWSGWRSQFHVEKR